MAAGRYGSHRDREIDLKSSKYKPYNLDRDRVRYREDTRARSVDLRDHLSDRRRDRPPRDSLNGYSSGSGSDRGRRVVEREPGELYSSSESPGSRDDMRRKTEDATLSSPSKKRKVSPVSRVKDEKKKSSLAPALPPLPPNGHIAPRSVEQPAPALPKETGIEWWNDDREPGEMDAEDGENAPARNISTSRWADANDFMDDVDEQAAPNVKKDKSGSSEGSDGVSSEPSSSGAAHMDVEEGAKASDSQLSDTDSEEDGDGRAQTPEAEEIPEPEQTAGVVLNMMQGCRNVDEFERLNKINEGTYGVVYRAKDKKTGEIVALKKVKMEKEREGFPLTSLREMNILLSLRHPSIVGVKEVVVGSNLDSIFMVMEYMDHDLKALMEAMKQPFSQSEVKCLMLQLLEGVDYLHDNWVLHRDLKTSNLLMNNCGELKICDFGLSRQYGSPLKPYTHLVVTLWYRSPELLLGAKEYSTAIDMWSLGCIMAELLAKVPLFNGKTELDQLDKIFRILGTPNEKIWPGFTKLPGVKVNFVRQPYNKLRERFPPITTFSGRPTLSEAGFDLLNRLLTYDPVKRITAKDALNHPWFREIPLPKSKEFMPTYPAQNAHDRCKRRIMKSPDPLEEQRIRELQQGELGAGGIFG